jgi:hypothetical protein
MDIALQKVPQTSASQRCGPAQPTGSLLSLGAWDTGLALSLFCKVSLVPPIFFSHPTITSRLPVTLSQSLSYLNHCLSQDFTPEPPARTFLWVSESGYDRVPPTHNPLRVPKGTQLRMPTSSLCSKLAPSFLEIRRHRPQLC